jgi:hypothetical protein
MRVWTAGFGGGPMTSYPYLVGRMLEAGGGWTVALTVLTFLAGFCLVVLAPGCMFYLCFSSKAAPHAVPQ